MNGKPKESDWKRYRDMVSDLRERYLKEKNQELIDMLSALDKTPTEQFWDTLERMKKEKRILQDCLDPHSRSKMFMSMMLMLRCGMLKEEDLEGFSDELKGELNSLLN